MALHTTRVVSERSPVKFRFLLVPALVATMLLASCSSSGSSNADGSGPSEAQILDRGPVTNDSAREDLVKAEIAIACSSDDFVKCQSATGSGTFAVMVMSQDELDATFARICASLVTSAESLDPAVNQMRVVTDRRSFLVVGDTGLQFPDDVNPEKIRDVLGGQVVSFATICAPQN